MDKKKKIFISVSIILFCLISLIISLSYNNYIQEKKDLLSENVKFQLENQYGTIDTKEITKSLDPSIRNPLTTINPRRSFLNSSNDEVAYITHTGNIGGIGNLTFTNSNAGYGYFSYLGSSISKITKLWATDVEIQNSLNVSGGINSTGEIKINNNAVSPWLYNQSTIGLWAYNQTFNSIYYYNFSILTNENRILNSLNVSDNVNLSGVLYVNKTSGMVGIGTATPTEMLQIADFNTASNNYLYIGVDGGSLYKAGIKLRAHSDAYGFQIEYDDVLGGLNIVKRTGGVDTSTLFIDRTTGRVGIGTTAPTQKFEVVGNVNITGGMNLSGGLNVGSPTTIAGAGDGSFADDVFIGDDLSVTDQIWGNYLKVDSNVSGGDTGSFGFMDYFSGGIRYFSQGANATTRGKISFTISESDGENVLTPLFINSTGVLFLGTSSTPGTPGIIVGQSDGSDDISSNTALSIYSDKNHTAFTNTFTSLSPDAFRVLIYMDGGHNLRLNPRRGGNGLGDFIVETGITQIERFKISGGKGLATFSSNVTITGGLNISQWLNVGTATGAGTGSINASGNIYGANYEIRNGGNFTGGAFVVSHVINYNDASPHVIASVNDGYVVTDVYVKVTTAWDGDGTVTIGDGTYADGFMLDSALDKTVIGWKGGNREVYGGYLADWTLFPYSSRNYIYSTADTIDATIVAGTSTQGVMTIYISMEKLY